MLGDNPILQNNDDNQSEDGKSADDESTMPCETCMPLWVFLFSLLELYGRLIALHFWMYIKKKY